jgi:excisionase family DNA binding protein
MADNKINRQESTPEQQIEKSVFFENSVGTKAKLLSVDELAQYLGVSKKTVYGWVYRHWITPERIGPRLIRFNLEKIEQWIASQNAKE